MTKDPKQICKGSGKMPVATMPKPFAMGGKWGKCGRCTRILVPKKDGTLREHQKRNKKTASLDSTRDFLWANRLNRTVY